MYCLEEDMKGDEKGHLKNLGLASLGAVLEYFDFVVYVYVAAFLSDAFFPPNASPWIRLVQAFSIYAIGYLVRPLAGVAIAHFADRIGRKKLFVFTVLLMSVPTFLMGLLPTYAQVGWFAPAALLLLRTLQGCAVGGELPGASVFISEHASANRLGFYSGIFFGIVNCGLLLGAAAAKVSALVADIHPDFVSLQWRLPFMLGGAFGLMAAYLRRHLQETPLFAEIREERAKSKKIPLAVVLEQHKRACLFALGLVFVMSTTSGVYFQYLPNYLIVQLHYAKDTVFTANVIGVLAFVASMPAWGKLSDIVGWGKTIAIGAVVSACVSVWFFHYIRVAATADVHLTYAFVVVGLAAGCVHSTVPGLISSLFPTLIRQTGYTFPYSIGTAVFTGLTPLALAWLVKYYGLDAPMYAFLLACGVALIIAATVHLLPLYLGRTRPGATRDAIQPVH
ncbi:hypothetical protein AX768_31385 (plasmid) [Burkholderia sp. PAMC 28687]|jgi:MFS family permease|nr:hypothetical protein AX768_31385 [Burkholderia sp. PAMC 28687]